MTNDELILKIVKIIAKYDDVEIRFVANSSMYEKDKNKQLEDVRFFINCNDVFYWGCADSEEITEDNIDIFEQSLKDGKFYGEILFCARVRKMRPQGIFYEKMSEEYVKLFNEAGPERETDFCNPYDQNGAYSYRKPETKGEEN